MADLNAYTKDAAANIIMGTAALYGHHHRRVGRRGSRRSKVAIEYTEDARKRWRPIGTGSPRSSLVGLCHGGLSNFCAQRRRFTAPSHVGGQRSFAHITTTASRCMASTNTVTPTTPSACRVLRDAGLKGHTTGGCPHWPGWSARIFILRVRATRDATPHGPRSEPLFGIDSGTLRCERA